MILAIKTDVPEAEVYIIDGTAKVQKKWQAHRQLLETIHTTIKDVMEQVGKNPADINGVIFYEGPGSFTGLRIGCSVANAFATSYDAPIVAVTGNDWLAIGQQLLADGKSAKTVEPNYGQEPHITTPT
jgi:tRNA threonylcarbamoyladenosine biosynthesis protein TsaB